MKLAALNAIGLVSMLGVTSLAQADISIDMSGLIRQEMSYKTNSDENFTTQGGNPFNGQTVINALGTPITRPDLDTDNDWNQMVTRAEVDFQVRFSDNWNAYVKVRGIFDHNAHNDFGDVSVFESNFFGDCGSTLEVCGDNYMIDLPSAYLDYNNGGFWLRVGNQQIAWGEALFFRVADVANGLDLRRHSFIDYAAEEYADERVASPAIRGSYRLNEEWELEAFVQMFSPTILGSRNTPYNVVPSQFVVQEEEFFDKVDNDVTFGMRLRGQIGDLGLQFFAVNRRNPDGVVRWTTSNINPFAGSGVPALEGLGALLAETPFEIGDIQGVWTGDEWFRYAAFTRLNGVTGLDAAITEFAASGLLGAFPTAGDPTGTCAFLGATTDRACAGLELDVFFDPIAGPGAGGGLGPLRGHLAREYPWESVFGWGFNYLFFAEPDTLLDQLVMRFEMSVTPDKQFTNPSLSREYIEEDEYVASLIFEKYHRFSNNIPATFFVLQYMFKSESDLFGRHLSGNNNDRDNNATVGQPKGDSNFHAFAFALQQPSPTLKWRFDLSILYDAKGGVFAQPAVRWKPSSAVTIEAFYNFFHSDGGNDDIIESIETFDELGVRLAYQF